MKGARRGLARGGMSNSLKVGGGDPELPQNETNGS
jgi:hypothetical protein